MNKCTVCGANAVRKFCSKTCRQKHYNTSRREYQRLWQLRKGDIAREKREVLIQCKVCGRKFVQIGSHVVQHHGYTSARQYREEWDYDVKRGMVPEYYRKIKAEKVFENGTVKNLLAGKKHWFQPGQKELGKYRRSAQTMARLKKQFLPS